MYKPANKTIIADCNITRPFRVYDTTTGNYIFSIMSPHDAGDIPPDIAALPVMGMRSVGSDSGSVLYIDTATA